MEVKGGHIRSVVLISFDSLRSDYIANISPREAPNFCLMRDRGTFFKNTIVQSPMTIPSHASMLTGLYPAKTGVRDMHHRVSSDVPSVFTILTEEGVSTISASPERILTNIGFEGIDQQVSLRRRKLAKAITKLKGKRFFAFLHYWDTHTPYDTPFPGFRPMDILLNALKPVDRFKNIRLLGRFLHYLRLLRVERIRAMMKKGDGRILPAIIKGYKNAIIKADKFVGDVCSVLKVLEVTDETLLVLTGDHGDSFNEHNEINRAVGKRYEHGQFLYDNIVRVPLIFFWPKERFTRVFDNQVEQIDIVPTILEALNINYDGYLDGKSLWSAIIGRTENLESRFAFSEIVRESLGLDLKCVRSMSSKLIRDYKNKLFELYDLRADPEEKNNLWPAEGHHEKEILMTELQAFSRIEHSVETSYSKHEELQIKRMLRNLGYVD